MIEIQKLVKTFGHRVVLRGIDLTIGDGDFVTLLGANGAGKTTLLHIVATLSKPTHGDVRINGYRLAESASELRRFIGLVSHKPLLYEDLTALQNLNFYARMYDLVDAEQRIETVLRQVGLFERRTDPVRTYSRGMQQRLAIARAILHNPPILLLDEPDTGLDQHAADMLGQLLRAVGIEQRTILMTTHNLERGLSLGNRVVILAKGKIVYDVARQDIEVDQLRTQYYQHVG
ncbi:MAG TPA: heme ABC exporter ATP-binding protein CcmA [Anaerolineae bacterium]|nr:heme ABC exporter ATP-binding protein CcmA [Anaerolineae bacterium]MCB9105119.1 heme ABC exporter ATP-binding protein CcmA [Anaerolineales bacterium]HRV91986.1 heme ABC exporter ATP-binding protein CcmA [Anaerolineae bacterium]